MLLLAIVYQCYVTSTAQWAGIAFVVIVAVELMFKQIRKTNHEINYELPSYGLKDRLLVERVIGQELNGSWGKRDRVIGQV